MMMKAIWRKEKGFTLIELLIVVAIIGILAGIAVPRISQSLDDAKVNSCLANRNAIESAAELYRFNNDGYPELSDLQGANEDGTQRAFKTGEPKCPSGGTYEIDSSTGAVTCSVETHQ